MLEPNPSPKRQARTPPEPKYNHKIYFKPKSGPIIEGLVWQMYQLKGSLSFYFPSVCKTKPKEHNFTNT